MKRWILALLVMLAASPGFSKPRVAGPNETKSNAYTLTFPIGDTAESDAIGVNGMCKVRFVQASGDDVSLYAITTPTTAATSGTLLRSFTTSTTTTPYEFTPGTLYVKAVATDATAGGSTLTINCSPMAGGGGGDPDADNDGEYEYAILWDADGDGSTWVDCTDKDEPDSACKALGERIYGDLADDINCAIWDCGFGKMENSGTIYLEQGVYVNFPCWEPTNVTNTRGGISNDDEHDSTADSAWNICPATPDTDTTRRFYTIALMDWQGEIIGAGVDTRNPETTTSYIRNQGTYIVDDRGPSWQGGLGYANSGNNTWFGQAGFIRGINFGFDHGGLASSSAGSNTGEMTGDGDSKGYGTISGTQTVAQFEDNQGLCVANTSGLDTLVAGDILQIASQSGNSSTSPTVTTAMRVRDTPGVSTCNGAGTILIPLGGFVGNLGTNNSYAAAEPPYTVTFLTGNLVVAARSDYLDSTARLANLTIEPQDWWSETGGDCSEDMTTGSGAWVDSLDADATNADFDCDTNPLIGIWGGGAPLVENVVLRHWHQFAIDGASNVGFPLMSKLRFFYGRGGPIVDAGSGWRMHDFEIRDSQFTSYGMSLFGPGLEIRDFRWVNSSGTATAVFSDTAVADLVENVSIEAGGFMSAFFMTCGARSNTIRDTTVTNTLGIGRTSTSWQGIIAHLDCSDTTNPIEQNVFDGFVATGVKYAQQLSGNVTAAIALNTEPTIANPDSAAITRNTFMNGRGRATKSAYDFCMFAAIDVDTTAAPNDRTGLTPDDYSHEDVLALNTFLSNSVYSSGGGGGVDHMYCGCNVNAGGGGGASYATCSATVGSGSGIGANARGCLNIDINAAPSNETCS